VIVEVVYGLVCTIGRFHVAHLETGSIVLLFAVNRHEGGGTREIVQYPLRDISIADELLCPFDIRASDLAIAKILAVDILTHVYLEVRRHDPVAAQYFAQIEGTAVSAAKRRGASLVARRRADEGQIKVGILKLGVVGVDFVDEEGDVFLVSVGVDGVACRGPSARSAHNHESRPTDLECRRRLSRSQTTPASRMAIQGGLFGRPGEAAWCAEER
jgi:hypothetical protein